VNYAAGLTLGPYKLLLRAARTNRSTQHWVIEMTQAQADGSEDIVVTGTAITAARRETWSANDTPMPSVQPPAHYAPLPTPPGIEWLARYELRSVQGEIPVHWDGSENDAHPDQASLSQLWVRDVPARPLDFASLTAMADIFFPRVWVRRAKLVPAGTVSLTVYFHADASHLADVGDGYLFGQARAQTFRNGFFDQTGQLWSEAGVLLATTHQLVYFKE
jgi:acyl-CoA thioesterase